MKFCRTEPASVPGRGLANGQAHRGLARLLLGLMAAGCTSVLGIDGEYVTAAVKEEPDAGGATLRAETGGEAGAISESGGRGGTKSGIGAAASGGTAGASAGCGTGTACAAGEKCCPGVTGNATFCTAPEPAVGCSPDNCDRCPAPPMNAIAVCTGDQCDIKCNDKYQRVADQCEPVATGGATGAGGAGGQPATGTGGTSAPVCSAKQCPGLGGPMPGCSIASPLGCCRNDGKCGCTYAGIAYCL